MLEEILHTLSISPQIEKIIVVTKEEIMLNPLLKVILEGLYDEDCVMSKLRGCPHIIKDIWRKVLNHHKSLIHLPDKSISFNYMSNQENYTSYPSIDSLESALYVAPITENHWTNDQKQPRFPPPSNININMMPFVVGSNFKECRLPQKIKLKIHPRK